MQYRAVLFDMDGVVIDTEAAVTAFWERLAARHGVTLTPADYDTTIYGRPLGQTLDVLFPRLTEAERAAVSAEALDYETNQAYIAMPGVVDLLRALREKDIPAALVTSGERFKVAEVFRQLEIGGLFAAVVTAEDVPKGKPHPACYQLGAQRLGTPAARCVAFEDSISGVQAAAGAGTICIGVRPARTAAPLLAAGARGVIPDFSAARLEADRTLWAGEGLRVAFAPMQSC